MTTDEILSAFIDGELPHEEMEEVRREVERNASLARRVAALKSADRLVADAYSAIDDEPLPQRVTELLTPRGAEEGAAGGNVVAFPMRRLIPDNPQWAMAMAASLALAAGIGLGLQLSAGGAGNGEALIAGVIEKGGPVYAALESAPSAEAVALGGKGGAVLTPVLTFRSQAGDYCREFSVAAKGRASRAIACRGDDQWTVEFAVATVPQAADSETYATASSGLDAAFDAFVEDLIADAPLGAEDEKAAIEAGWKDGR